MIDEDTKISVIVPVYNVEKFIDRCVESLVNQTFKDIEIILVDDGSTDGSPAICDEWAKKDSRIKVIHKKNGGASDARNAGLDLAKGRYVGFVDSDDFIEPDAYETLFEEAESKGYDVIYTGNKTYRSDGTFSVNGVLDIEYRKEEIPTHIKKMLYDENLASERDHVVLSASMGIYSREVIEQNSLRFWVGYFGEDILFNIDFLMHSERVRCLPKSFYHYCYNGESRTQSFKESKIYQIFQLYEALVDKVKCYGLQDMEWRAMLMFVDYMIWITKSIILPKGPIARKRELCGKVYDYDGWSQIIAATHNAPIRRRERLQMWIVKHKAFWINYMVYVLYYRYLKK